MVGGCGGAGGLVGPPEEACCAACCPRRRARETRDDLDLEWSGWFGGGNAGGLGVSFAVTMSGGGPGGGVIVGGVEVDGVGALVVDVLARRFCCFWRLLVVSFFFAWTMSRLLVRGLHLT